MFWDIFLNSLALIVAILAIGWVITFLLRDRSE